MQAHAGLELIYPKMRFRFRLWILRDHLQVQVVQLPQPQQPQRLHAKDQLEIIGQFRQLVNKLLNNRDIPLRESTEGERGCLRKFTKIFTRGYYLNIGNEMEMISLGEMRNRTFESDMGRLLIDFLSHLSENHSLAFLTEFETLIPELKSIVKKLEDRAQVRAETSTSSSSSTSASSSSSSTSSSQPASNTEGECAVCMEEPAKICNAACGHECLCEKCAKDLTKCPLCRSPVTTWVKVIRSARN